MLSAPVEMINCSLLECIGECNECPSNELHNQLSITALSGDSAMAEESFIRCAIGNKQIALQAILGRNEL